eukprot:2477735-Rhodomonas_salina.2
MRVGLTFFTTKELPGQPQQPPSSPCWILGGKLRLSRTNLARPRRWAPCSVGSCPGAQRNGGVWRPAFIGRTGLVAGT